MTHVLQKTKYILVIILLAGCSTSQPFLSEDLAESELTSSELMSMIPDYRESLNTIKGNGRAIVSEPDGSDRVTLQFQSNRDESLITVRTSVGVEGGQIYVDRDSLLIYNRVDRIAEKVPLAMSSQSSVGSIASLNMLDLFNFTFDADNINRIYEDSDSYVALLQNNSRIFIEKSAGRITEVVHSESYENAPYSRIEYEGYAEIEEFYLPRKITIFSRDGQSRATFLVQQLEVNETLPRLGIDLPEDIPIYRP